MPKLGEIIRGITRLAEEGYVFTEEDRSSLVRIANNLELSERRVLFSVLKELGLELEIDNKEIMESWIALAEIAREEGYRNVETITELENLYDLENPIENYPFSLEEDMTVAGMLYKGDHRYDTLLSHFSPGIAANVYLVHYKHKLKSIKAFYTLIEVKKSVIRKPYKVIVEIFNKMSGQRIFGFLTRMKSNALNVLGADKCRKLGTIIFESFLASGNLVFLLYPEYVNEDILHLIYILGLDREKLREMYLSEDSIEAMVHLMQYYEIFKPLYMKYRELSRFVPPEKLVTIQYFDTYRMYPSLVGEEGERLYKEFYEYVERLGGEI